MNEQKSPFLELKKQVKSKSEDEWLDEIFSMILVSRKHYRLNELYKRKLSKERF